ncbi:MAG: gluconate 2-dehydrogenase subunit 3 family protein [Myxococcota bacterium]
MEAAVLSAMVGRLLPSGVPGLPGANETGVVDFIDGQMSTRAFRPARQFLRRGVILLERVARKERKKAFVELSPREQDDILSRFQSGRVQGLRFPTARFFDIMLTLTLEGHLSHPRHGGNQDRKAWKALGIDPQCPHEVNGHSHG